MARDVIGIYGVEKEKLRGALKGRRVCLTTNTWTSIQNLNYMSLVILLMMIGSCIREF